ncbi:hypothetical protein HQ520_02555 [bacterium]|nr:hypothetical protein [bacterium]
MNTAAPEAPLAEEKDKAFAVTEAQAKSVGITRKQAREFDGDWNAAFEHYMGFPEIDQDGNLLWQDQVISPDGTATTREFGAQPVPDDDAEPEEADEGEEPEAATEEGEEKTEGAPEESEQPDDSVGKAREEKKRKAIGMFQECLQHVEHFQEMTSTRAWGEMYAHMLELEVRANAEWKTAKPVAIPKLQAAAELRGQIIEPIRTAISNLNNCPDRYPIFAMEANVRAKFDEEHGRVLVYRVDPETGDKVIAEAIALEVEESMAEDDGETGLEKAEPGEKNTSESEPDDTAAVEAIEEEAEGAEALTEVEKEVAE